jgi:hypothetical protein
MLAFWVGHLCYWFLASLGYLWLLGVDMGSMCSGAQNEPATAELLTEPQPVTLLNARTDLQPRAEPEPEPETETDPEPPTTPNDARSELPCTYAPAAPELQSNTEPEPEPQFQFQSLHVEAPIERRQRRRPARCCSCAHCKAWMVVVAQTCNCVG